MISHVKKLIHFDGLEIDGIPGRHGDSAKLIGDYTTEDRALQGMTRVADQPGFRDWPDSFRLFDIEVDRDFFREGFRTGNGEDIAIADDSSGYAGNDEGLEEWDNYEGEGDVPRNRPDDIPDNSSDPYWSCPFWELYHYKISARNTQNYGDMGMKLVGIYSSLAKAKAALSRLRDKPGFRDWPEGWRIEGVKLDEDRWLEGYGPAD